MLLVFVILYAVWALLVVTFGPYIVRRAFLWLRGNRG